MKLTHLFALGCAGLALGACGGGGGTGMDLGAPLDAGGSDTGMPGDGGRDLGPRDLGPMTDAGTDISAVPAADHADAVAVCMCDPMSRGFLTTADCVTGLSGLAAAATCEQMGADAAPPDVAAYFNCLAMATQTHTMCVSSASPACSATALDTCDTNLGNDRMACPNPASGTAYQTARDACIASTVVGTMADACSDTAAASMMVGTAAFTGTTVGHGDSRQGSCVTGAGGSMGPDVAIRWTAPAAGTYTIDTLGSLFDTVIYVMDGCGTTAMELACNDDIDGNALNYRSSIDLTVTAGQTVQIIVDGYSDAAAGNYVVNIHAAAAVDGGVMDAGSTDAGDVDAGTSADASTAG